MQPLTPSRQRAAAPPTSARAVEGLAAPALALLYAVAVWRLYPHDAFSMNPDEGINSMKALLVDHGYRLYEQIWSDQPPLFTHLLRLWLDFLGWSVMHGRLLVLLFAALLVFAVYDLVRLSWNHLAALTGVLLLVSSTYFLPLSVSVMIGIPSLALAMMSLWGLARWRRGERRGWLLASAALMSGSLCIKLFTMFLLPLFAAWIVLVAPRPGRGRAWRAALLWLAGVLLPTAALLFALAGATGIEQLIEPHWAARGNSEFVRQQGFLVLERIAPLDFPLVVLASIGTVQIVRRRCWELAILPVWAATALVLLLSHAPVWHHHYLLLTVVAGPTAGVAVAETFASRRRAGRAGEAPLPAAARVAGVLALLGLAVTLPIAQRVSRPVVIVSWEAAQATLDAMQRFTHRTRHVLTDAPMYAFRAGLDVVPDLTVVSLKRKGTGNLTVDDVVGGLQRYAPEQVLLTGRFPVPATAALLQAMEGRYALVYTSPAIPSARLYVRRDIVERATSDGDSRSSRS
jgi:Dolichyl-phosphate-mannose-protein mannosyltransferase